MSRLKDAALRSSDTSCASTVDRLQQAEKTPAKTVHAHRGADPYNWFICNPLTRRSMKFAAIQPAALPWLADEPCIVAEAKTALAAIPIVRTVLE
ncbi:hypothetical protein [Pseudomonas piscis]|uniref:hypothetical protein n=1 Tax=Pseudomonas piscis TaxID=2614538 RepID=UPI0015B4F9B3|nr:hypothetical protein [Pseudomonas piscis]